MLWIVRWLILFGAHAQDVRDPSDRFAPPGWQGNPWGPAATRARAEGRLPAIVMTPAMTRWDRWGRAVLRDGDIVFRMGDSRTLSRLLPVQPVPRRRQRQSVLPHGDRRHRGRRAGRLRLHQAGRPPAAVRRLDPGQRRGVRREAAQGRAASGDPRGARLLPEGLRAAGAVRLQLRPGRLRALLPGDDGEGLPLAGPGPVRAGPARRHGERHPIPDLHRPVRVALAAGAEEAPHPGAGGLHARERATRAVGVAAPGGGLSAPGRSNDPGHPPPGRPIQPGGRPRDRRVHRERIPDERPAAVAAGGPVRPRFTRIRGRGRPRLPPDGLGPLPPRHRGPGG